ncbi:hypothetical protein E4U43_000868 [Claviceps pusilla]|uniref:DNA-dependent ATPase MGS1 n=1 Tax=Claviceps pusilla TaxID=123648 RepID=A0A9P7SWE5_9HYPO|nr:hypothetical protein E4U43_000868 [Claviceps pusilla]
MAVNCPICNRCVKSSEINSHIDSGCTSFIVDTSKESPPTSQALHNGGTATQPSSSSSSSQQQQQQQQSQQQKRSAASFFSTPVPKRIQLQSDGKVPRPRPVANGGRVLPPIIGKKRAFEDGPGAEHNETTSFSSAEAEQDGRQNGKVNGHAHNHDVDDDDDDDHKNNNNNNNNNNKAVKRTKTQRSAPLAERMRPKTLDEVCGQELVGPKGVLRSLIESNRVPSMILWGASGTGKTTIARCIAQMVGGRFIELNATSTGVGECKKLFQEAASELALTGRKTIIFCDEIHRFNKSQQDVFLKPVEAGTVTLIGATTENPSFKVAAALLSRCRTFTLQPLTTEDILGILRRASRAEQQSMGMGIGTGINTDTDTDMGTGTGTGTGSSLLDDDMLGHLAQFSDGDARTALNLLELALSLTAQPGITKDAIKASLTKTLVYDRGGDQHYDSISAFHKSVRGNDPDAALYYLARMLQSGEDALFIARRMVVIASEDVGLADNSLLPLATATYTATQQIGMPEARIPLAHCALALCLAPKSTRAYRALNNAYAALREPGVAGLPVPLHLRNAPTRLMRDMGCGAAYKYPPNYRDGKVQQTYLPPELEGRRFLEDRDLGTELDPDLQFG